MPKKFNNPPGAYSNLYSMRLQPDHVLLYCKDLNKPPGAYLIFRALPQGLIQGRLNPLGTGVFSTLRGLEEGAQKKSLLRLKKSPSV